MHGLDEAVASAIISDDSDGSAAAELHVPAGKFIRTAVPRPSPLVTESQPPDCSQKAYAWLSPRPEPRPGSFVVKKGSVTRLTIDSGMPVPLSMTRIETIPLPSESASILISPPPFGMAS